MLGDPSGRGEQDGFEEKIQKAAGSLGVAQTRPA